MKMRKVGTNFDNIEQPGDFHFIEKDGKICGVLMRCPGCGDIISTNEGWTIMSQDPLTLTPSIRHIRDRQGLPDCHFYIINGEVVVC